MKSCDDHDHARLQQPIDSDRFLKEFMQIYSRAGFMCKRPAVVFSRALGRTHCRNHRRYASVVIDEQEFSFAPQILWLPKTYRLGLIAHEIGHVLCPEGDEDDADTAALDVLCVSIKYDRSFPGKGLQSGVDKWGEFPPRRSSV